MADSITIRRSYKYRLYRNDKRDVVLREHIRIAGTIWNHALALQKRYYRLTGKYITLGDLQSHIARLRTKTARFAFWQPIGSQAVQDMLERLDNAYVRFFTGLAKRPPKYKKVRQRISFTLKQSGWKLLRHNENKQLSENKYRRARGVIVIQGVKHKFVQHRPMHGTVKTVMIKRDTTDRLWLIFSVIEQMELPKATTPSRVAGFDFGLKTFLTDHTGREYTSPLCHQHALRRLRIVQSRKDKKRHQSNNRRKAARYLSRLHIRIADKRRDAHFKLAHELCEQYDVLYFEDLNIEGMKALWGRKVSDLAFSKFLTILKHIAMKQGKIVLEIGRFERTTGKCSKCGHIQAMTLRERVFCCKSCGFVLGRDHNAAINILQAGKTLSAGASAPTTLVAVSRVRKTTRRHARR